MSAALDLLHGLVIEDGRRWGEAAAGFQRADAEVVLAEDSATPYSFLTRPRGGSKTTDVGGMALAALLEQLGPGDRGYCAASDRDQARLLLDSVEGFVARTPELAGAVTVNQWRVTATRSGASLDVLAADAAGSWGLRPAFLVLDEIAQWPQTPGPRTFLEALTSAMAKLPGSRMAIITSAGDPAHFSRKLLDHAIEDPSWYVSEVPGPVPWLDPARVKEQRRRLPESSFARLFLNQWAASEDRLVDDDALGRCVVLDGPLAPEPGRRYVVGLDVGVRHDATVAAVCCIDGEGRTRLDRLQVWRPARGEDVDLGVVEEWLLETTRRYNNAALVFDPWQALALARRLRSAGVTTHEFAFNAGSVSRLAPNLVQLVREHRLALPDDDALLDELRAVRLVERSPGLFRVDHDASGHDDQVIALGLAALHLTSRPSSEMRVFDRRGQAEPVYRSGDLTLVGSRYIDKPSPSW